MVSRRNFISICILMGVLLFMFQFSQVIKESESDYAVNTYVSDQKVSGGNRWTSFVGDITQEGECEAGDYVLFFGDLENSIGTAVLQWCQYSKRNLIVSDDLEGYEVSEEHMPEVILVDSYVADVRNGIRTLDNITGQDVTLVFCRLPSPVELRRDGRLMRMLGIREVQANSVEVEGIHLFSGFLLGGDGFYTAGDSEEELERQDLDLNMPWYILSGGTEVYMVGMLDEMLEENEARNELFPCLIWKKGYDQAIVYAVNGDYMEGWTGIGILDAIMYKENSYVIYPVVNAQNVMVTNFPNLSEENKEQVQALYSRSTEGLMRDICWPSIASMMEQGHYRATCFLTTKQDYSDSAKPSGNMIPFYLQQFKEFDSEAGLSLIHQDNVNLENKLAQDEAFYTAQEVQYNYSAVYMEREELERLEELMAEQMLLHDIRTVAAAYQEGDPVVSYYNNGVTLQSTTADAQHHNYSDDLRVRALETALGYSNVLMDMSRVVWPEDEGDEWQNMSENLTSNLNTYWRLFTAFEKTTLSESDVRIRNFLNLDYEDWREEDTIHLELSGAQGGWFILRTHGESIADIKGAEWTEIETDAYLIHARQTYVEIELQKNRGLMDFF
ncbi:MAG: DUF2194 domain-containing protein [Candidatus Gastranaerophilales bacterium]|nr:DUF2194 domain-containing protein [Candidatus Gastranaerophilales bacterium]